MPKAVSRFKWPSYPKWERIQLNAYVVEPRLTLGRVMEVGDVFCSLPPISWCSLLTPAIAPLPGDYLLITGESLCYKYHLSSSYLAKRANVIQLFPAPYKWTLCTSVYPVSDLSLP